MHDGSFFTEHCVTLACSELETYIQNPDKYLWCRISFRTMCSSRYLKPWHIQNPRHIHNTVKHLSWNILFKTLYYPDIFITLVYQQLWYTLKSKHIQNPPAAYPKCPKWSILLRTLCNYNKFKHPIYAKFSHIQNQSVSATP